MLFKRWGSTRYSKIMLIALLYTLFLISCGKNGEKDTIKIGVAVCLTGDVAPYGQRTMKGIRLATELENDDGGIDGRRIELIVEDTQSEPRIAVVAINKLIDVNKVHVVVGDVLSSTTLAMAPIAEERRIVLLAPGASHPSMRDAGDYVFRNWVSDDFDGKAMAQFIWKQGITTLGTLTQQNDYCIGLSNALINEYERLGGSVISGQVYQTGVLDLRTQLENLRKADPDAIYLSGEARGSGIALKQMAEIEYRPTTYSNMSVEMTELQNIAGEAVEGVIYSTPAFDTASAHAYVSEFVTSHRERFGENPDVTTAIGYDAIRILVQVMREYGITPGKIKEGLYRVHDFPGVSGVTTFDEHGDVIKDVYVKRITGEGAVLLEQFKFSSDSIETGE